MIPEFLLERVALFATGELTPEEREEFALILEFHQELRVFAAELGEVTGAMMLAAVESNDARPSPELKARIFAKIQECPAPTPEGLVMSGPEGLVGWVNPAFTEMCGYTLTELRGKSLGPILQGANTNRDAAARMKAAVKKCAPCRETILNYHKNGHPYWVDIAITPIRDETGRPVWLVAREREIPQPSAA